MAAYREEWSVFQVHGDASYLFPLPPLDVLADQRFGSLPCAARFRWAHFARWRSSVACTGCGVCDFRVPTPAVPPAPVGDTLGDSSGANSSLDGSFIVTLVPRVVVG